MAGPDISCMLLTQKMYVLAYFWYNEENMQPFTSYTYICVRPQCIDFTPRSGIGTWKHILNVFQVTDVTRTIPRLGLAKHESCFEVLHRE